MTKYYTSSEILSIYSLKSAEEKVEILWEALDFMNQSNTRTRFYCVALALGYENTEGEDDTYTKISER